MPAAYDDAHNEDLSCQIVSKAGIRTDTYCNVFPGIDHGSEGVCAEIRITVRFQPSFSPESQIVLTVNESKAELLYQQSGAAGTEATARAIPVSRKFKSIDEKETRQWLKQFWAALAKAPVRIREKMGHIQLDGTQYSVEVEVETSSESISLVVRDEEVDDSITGKMELVRWMNKLRLSIQ